MKTYTGTRAFDGLDVRVDGEKLNPRTDLKLLSKNGFEWSFEGASPHQLALAILADATDDATALRLSRDFMEQIVANFDNDWEMTEADVKAAVQALERA
ncbi:MAG: DUF6166 domain-containing protein [Alphaproteobacteria bacterium]|jgi:hypothetical protein|uniref:DUF6166 domain-containing protein n=1 Tax=Pacificispira sp. TaxID=2888761 RepID=UPI001B291729|nr:hypothetical protein [Alphaproteobacteria bacterium]MBO6861078.1 hypothetical protein [Alphaproteobacteria bacterium]MEC9267308.1 DUF6166 domain-containing protein [Pseudomonadota bacterium]